MALDVSRAVIEDCRLCLDMMEEEENPDRFRVVWIGGLALLRSVGHCLKNIDCVNEPQRSILSECWQEWKDEPIFSEFIVRSRNLALKEYKVLAEEGVFGPVHIVGNCEELYEIPSFLFRQITDGFGEGEDSRDIFEEAIKWWEVKLNDLERCLK